METMEKTTPTTDGRAVVEERPKRITLEEMDYLSTGKRTRLHRLLYDYGPGNGTMLLLPVDQGVEHGPIDFLVNPPALDPEFQIRLAIEGGFSGVVFHIGISKKYMWKYAGKIPLILKINGKTNIPSDAQAFSALDATVEDAVHLGADAVGYTLYVGSPRQDDDFLQLMKVREDCDKYGMPLIVWSYPRGEAVKAKGGNDSLYAVDYAARLAMELGADVIKLNVPEHEKISPDQPKPYNEMNLGYAGSIAKVVRSAGKSMVLFSGGSKISDEDLLMKAQMAMDNGATGLIFGRNLWQRPFDQALQITERIKEVMRNT
jgi:class I fructose-bisphosphate aldolase